MLEGHFGHMDIDTSISTTSTEKSRKKTPTDEKMSDIPEKIPATPSEVGGLATSELVFPLKSIPSVITGLREPYLLLCGLKTLSRYHCQFPSCSLEFSQKAAACNHIHHDYLNVALACLYCSFENKPKMHWYSASTWEHHTLKHLKENLPIHPNDPAFSQQFAYVSGDEATPSTSKPQLNLPHGDVIHKQAEAAKQFLEEEGDPEGGQHIFHCPSTGYLKLSFHEVATPKHHVKQGPVKSSKKFKETKAVKSKDKDE